MKTYSTLAIVIGSALALCGCNPVVDFTGTYSGSVSYNLNCPDTSPNMFSFSESENYAMSQSGKNVTAQNSSGGCTFTGTASGTTMNVDPNNGCPTLVDSTDNVSYTYDISGGTFTVDSGGDLGVSLQGTATYMDPTGATDNCTIDIEASLQQN